MKDFDFTPEPSNAVLIGGALLPRELTDLSIWKKTPYDAAHALADLFLMANTEAGTHKLEGGMEVKYGPGWCLWSNKGLADRWGWRREAVERFLNELEKSEIILRPDLGQNRKAIVLRDFAQPTVQPKGQQSVPQNVQPNGTVRVQSTENRAGADSPPIKISLEQALDYFRVNGSGYSDAKVEEQWLYYSAMRHPVTGDWQRPGRTGVMTPISDWRSEMCRALKQFNASTPGGGSEKNGGGISVAQAVFKLDAKIKELTVQREAFEDTQPDLVEKLTAELDRLQAQRRELAA